MRDVKKLKISAYRQECYRREARDCHAAAALNVARGPAYEAWAKWYDDRAKRYEAWSRGEAVEFP